MSRIAVESHPMFPKFNDNSPRYRCCRLHVRVYAQIIAIAEIVFAVIQLIAAIVVAVKVFTLVQIGIIIGGVTNGVLVVIVSVLLIIAVRRKNPSLLVPYMVFKGIQLSFMAAGLVLSFIGLGGITAMLGYISERMYLRAYVSRTAADTVTNSLTTFFALLTVCLIIGMAILVWLLTVVLQCHQYLRDKDLFALAGPSVSFTASSGEPPTPDVSFSTSIVSDSNGRTPTSRMRNE